MNTVSICVYMCVFVLTLLLLTSLLLILLGMFFAWVVYTRDFTSSLKTKWITLKDKWRTDLWNNL